MIAKIDAHHHLYTRDSGHYPLFNGPDIERFYGNTRDLKGEFGIAQFVPLARAQNVVKSVYVESGFLPSVEETAHIQSIADEHGFPHAIIGKVDLESASVAEQLDVHLKSPNFRGVRLSLNWDADPKRSTAARAGLAFEPRWRAGYALLGGRALSADIMILPPQFGDVMALAGDYPGIPIILNHTGLPFADGAHGLPEWRDGMRRMSQYPNIAVKLSGFGMVDRHWTEASIREIILTTIDLFGADRCLFASNFPVDGLYSTYDALFAALDSVTRGFSESERIKMFHDTAARLYRL